MTAARKQAFNSPSNWRSSAYAAVNICWKQMRPDLIEADYRDERLAWVAEYLGLAKLGSLKDLTDDQLGAVAGEMKRLTGYGQSPKAQVQRPKSQVQRPKVVGNIVSFPAARNPVAVAPGSDAEDLPPRPPKAASTPPKQGGEILEGSFAPGSHEQVYTLTKLEEYLKWPAADMAAFLTKRFKCTSFSMLKWKQATSCTHQLLMIAAHRDLKLRSGGKPVSRAEIAKYIPILKAELGIDQRGKR